MNKKLKIALAQLNPIVGDVLGNVDKLITIRSRLNSDRKVTYYLAEELEHMFIKIIDASPERTNTLKLLEVLSLG